MNNMLRYSVDIFIGVYISCACFFFMFGEQPTKEIYAFFGIGSFLFCTFIILTTLNVAKEWNSPKRKNYIFSLICSNVFAHSYYIFNFYNNDYDYGGDILLRMMEKTIISLVAIGLFYAIFIRLKEVSSRKEYGFKFIKTSIFTLFVCLLHILMSFIFDGFTLVFMNLAAASMFILIPIMDLFETNENNQFIRGTEKATYEKFDAWAQNKRADIDPGLLFGGTYLPSSEAQQHFLFLGQTGSGKSTQIQLLMQSCLPMIGKYQYPNEPFADHRALIYDDSGEAYRQLNGLLPLENIVNFNPFDKRSYVWDIAKDIKSPADAKDIANIFFPTKENEQDKIWSTSARLVMEHVIKVLRMQDGDWMFSDLFKALISPGLVGDLLLLSRSSKEYLKLLLENRKNYINIMVNLSTYASEYSVLASLWDDPKLKRYSLSEWINQNRKVLILAGKDSYKKTIEPFYRLVLSRAFSLLMDQTPNIEGRRTWIFLDELAAIKEIIELSQITTKGRKYGVSLVFGVQDVDPLLETYKRNAFTILGQPSYLSIGKIQGIESLRWACEIAGKFEGMVSSFTMAEHPSETITPRVQESLLNAEFSGLKKISFEDDGGCEAWFFNPHMGPYKFNYNPRFLKHRILEKDWKDSPQWSDFIPREIPDDLKPWTQQDLIRLNLDKKIGLQEISRSESIDQSFNRLKRLLDDLD